MSSVYAEDVNFWMTGRSAPDVWIERTKRQIEALGGSVTAEVFGMDENGLSAFMLGFRINGDTFKIIWPVLPTKTGKLSAARSQAATMLYHYIKSVCLYAVVVGTRSAFYNHLMLPDGRTVQQLGSDELILIKPPLFLKGE